MKSGPTAVKTRQLARLRSNQAGKGQFPSGPGNVEVFRAELRGAGVIEHPADKGFKALHKAVDVFLRGVLLIELLLAGVLYISLPLIGRHGFLGRVAEDLNDLRVDIVAHLEDVGAEREAQVSFRFGIKLCDGGNVGQRGDPIRRTDGETFEIPARQMVDDRGVVGVGEVDGAVENSQQTVAAAGVRGQGHVIAHRVEDQRLDVPGAARAGVGHFDLAGAGRHVVEQILQRVVGGVLTDDDGLRVVDDGGDRRKVVIGDAVGQAHDAHGAERVGGHDHRVAVGVRIQTGLNTDRAGRAALVDDRDGLTELFLHQDGELAGRQVTGAAGAVRNDNGDRLFGEIDGRLRGRLGFGGRSLFSSGSLLCGRGGLLGSRGALRGAAGGEGHRHAKDKKQCNELFHACSPFHFVLSSLRAERILADSEDNRQYHN